MAKNVHRIAEKLGAVVQGGVPDTGGGALGMARLSEILARRLQPSEGLRPGRPSDPTWVTRGKVPMSADTKAKLSKLADEASSQGRRVSPMQIAAQLLEERLEAYSLEDRGR